MVLDKLSESLKATLKKIASALFIDEKLMDEIVKDIQRALLHADVNVQLVFEISKKKPFKIMMVGLFGSGKCVHPESEILLSTGEMISAEKLYQRYNSIEKEQLEDGEIIDITPRELFIPSFNPKTLKIENKKATHLWRLKGKDLLEIFLDNGNDFSVKVTPEHPFFALRKGELKQIKADELS